MATRRQDLAHGPRPSRHNTGGVITSVAVTCHVGPADNLAVFAALPLLQAGDVIVAAADGYRETAVVGDLVLGMARKPLPVASGCARLQRTPRTSLLIDEPRPTAGSVCA